MKEKGTSRGEEMGGIGRGEVKHEADGNLTEDCACRGHSQGRPHSRMQKRSKKEDGDDKNWRMDVEKEAFRLAIERATEAGVDTPYRFGAAHRDNHIMHAPGEHPKT